MVILSGPEPQRTFLEDHLTETLPEFEGKIVFIKGKIEAEQQTAQSGNITFYNFMTSEQLEQTFNESEAVLCRSGYTTIMDLAKLGKKAFFIPTPGQYEQEYLAKKLKRDGLVPYISQEEFHVGNLLQIDQLAQTFEGLRAVHVRHHHVEQDEVRCEVEDVFQGFLTAGTAQHLKASNGL